MKMKYLLLIVAFPLLILLGCADSSTESTAETETFYPTSKPGTRWWWFATKIKEGDVKHQLDWAKENNFGAVEIAWVYPLYRYQKMYAREFGRYYPEDSSAQEWLSEEWTDIVAYTKRYADSIGIACDFTFGSAWPVAGSNVEKKNWTQIYGDTSFHQKLTFAWSYPTVEHVIDHLNKEAFAQFSQPVGDALAPALEGTKSALFTDSWEIKLNATNKIWTQGFDSTFKIAFGYDIIPYMEQGIDSFPDVRYDYMMHLDEYVTNGFYIPYVEKCKELGAWSRVQCLASPTDVMTTYSLVDIPETESMLNNPNYSRIVSSSACLASKPMVSSETFTCMYGFPSTYFREEQMADLKMVADAMFSQGVNQHFYHGMPFNPAGSDSVYFFATTYFGPNGSLSEELPAFNAYMEKVSGYLQSGKTYSDVAVYIPYEDGVMKGAYPPERQRVWVWGEYEMRYIYTPEELEGYHPLWINRHFLEKANFKNGLLTVGDASFSSLYVDVKFMDVRALERIHELATQGLPICIKQNPKQPGVNKSPAYKKLLKELQSLKNVSSEVTQVIGDKPLIHGDNLPQYWARVLDDGSMYLFLAQSSSKNIVYPIYSGQSHMKESEYKELTFNYNGHNISQTIEFKPYQSVMLKISPDGEISTVDISFIPKDPIIREREPQRMHF